MPKIFKIKDTDFKGCKDCKHSFLNATAKLIIVKEGTGFDIMAVGHGCNCDAVKCYEHGDSLFKGKECLYKELENEKDDKMVEELEKYGFKKRSYHIDLLAVAKEME